MPAFRFLYEWKSDPNDPLQKELEKQVEGAAWNWPEPRNGEHLVPSGDARALVAYLLSLKRDRDIPRARKP
jgi:hypothetical protein